jgi:hypothetical protein
MKPALCILAAGIGSRFGGFKQMEPVGPGGEILLDYAIYDARKAGFGTIVFVVTKKLEPDFRGYMESRYGSGADFAYVHQELDNLPAGFGVPAGRIKPWGTGHAVLAAEQALTVPFAVINADDYYGQRSYAVLCDALASMKLDSSEMVMVGFEVEKTLSEHGAVSRGVCAIRNGYLASVVEREKIRKKNAAIVYETPEGQEFGLDPKSPVSMNCWGFAPQTIFPMLRQGFAEFLKTRGSEPKAEFYLPSVVNDGVTGKKMTVRVLESGEQWFGLTYPDDRNTVREYIQKRIQDGVYPGRLF